MQNFKKTTMKTFKRMIFGSLFVLTYFTSFSQNEIKSTNIIKQRLDSIIYIGGNQKYEYYYENNGKNISFLAFTWSSTQMKFIRTSKEEYFYDKVNNVNLINYYTWDNSLNQWSIFYKFEKTYDEKNQPYIEYTYIWNKTENKWEVYEKVDKIYSYDANDNISTIIRTQTKSGTISKTKSDYTYFNKNISSCINWFLDINERPETWKYSTKQEYVYDLNSNKTEEKSYDINPNNTAIWILKGKTEYVYNSNLNYSQLILPIGLKSNNQLMSVKGFDISGTQTVEVKYYYSSMEVTGIENLSVLKMTVFPNPATDFLNIQWNENKSILNVKLFDITGKKVFSGMVDNNYQLPIQVYPKGIYLVNISDGKTTKTEKVYFK